MTTFRSDMATICSVYECANVRDGKSLMCSKHRRRKRLYGDPSITKNNPPGTGFIAYDYKGFQINGRKVFEHVLIAERALGHPLPAGAVVHHANGIRADNRRENLVICQNKAYHNLLHARMRARDTTGNPNSKRCRHCGMYDNQEAMRTYEKKRGCGTFVYSHPECDRKANRKKLKEDAA